VFSVRVFAAFSILAAFTQRGGSLAAGGGIGKARTGGKLPNSCEVSHETTPPLAPNCLLHAGISCFYFSLSLLFSVYLSKFAVPKNIKIMRKYKLLPCYDAVWRKPPNVTLCTLGHLRQGFIYPKNIKSYE